MSVKLPRIIQLHENKSFFLFGARGTGKTTLLHQLPWLRNALMINLLEATTENRLNRNPDQLIAMTHALSAEQMHIVIDEIQKIPKLLDIVHHLIETTNKHFILTGSSARRLKREGVNLLAGRAFVYHLFPFTFTEVDEKFDLKTALQYGMLPKRFEFDTEEDIQLFLEAYTNTYLKEEIWIEKFVRELEPFRYFLEVAAQCNGKVINFANIAKDIGASDRTVKDYYTILEDTLLGFFLQPFQHSFRKRLSKKPKFYFFDTGITRTLQGYVTLPLSTGTSAYGEAFEHFIILQIIQFASYYYRHYRFSYLTTKDGAEIDLVVERPGKKTLFIEIKSTDNVEERHLKTLSTLSQDFGDCEAICLSRDRFAKQFNEIKVWPWMDGISNYFVSNHKE